MTTLELQGAAAVHQTFHRIVRSIPEGRVATYGQVAALAELPRNARQVGYALARLGACAAERSEASSIRAPADGRTDWFAGGADGATPGSEAKGHGEDGMGRNSESARRFGALRDDSVPWHRVVNARGEVSERGLDPLESVDQQRFLLEEEGVLFDRRGRVDLDRFGWAP